ADMLDFAAIILDRDLIADDEWLVGHDGNGGEKVTENVLNSQRYRQAADPQTRQQRLDLDAQARQRCDTENYPDRQSGDNAQRLEARDVASVRRVQRHEPLDVVVDDDVGPNHALREERDDRRNVRFVLSGLR